jgi:hypothetical protein
VTLPTFILETRSTLERLTDWMVHANIRRLSVGGRGIITNKLRM